MEVGEENKSLTEVLVFAGNRFFNLEQNISCCPSFFSGGYDLRTSGFVSLIGDRRAETCSSLNENFVSVTNEFVHACGGNCNAELVVLDFGGDCDLHDTPSTGSSLVG